MAQSNEADARAKGVALWALAQQNPDFAPFYERYREELSAVEALPGGFADDVLDVLEADPEIKPLARQYVENAASAASYAAEGLSAVCVMAAALFLLGTHIKIHRSPAGKWEFLIEHKGAGRALLEKIAQVLAGLLGS